MASRMQLEKLISDVNECVAELIKEFSIYKVPINDDDVALHRFEEKLEFVLQHAMKEKLNILGSKKSFWDYISATFTSLKRSHEGLKYVRSMSELKTSLGRGRALIRFCLMHKCLADTLQTCFTDDKITNEYYYETSIPVQEKHSTALIESLYELNELNFDLIPRHADLDISWPTFARKVFLSENLSPPSRNDSVTSFTSQNNLEAASFFESHNECLGDQNMTQLEDRKDSMSCINLKIKVDERISEKYPEMERIERNPCNSEESDCQAAKVNVDRLKYENDQLLKKVADLEHKLTLKYSNSLQTLDKENMGVKFPHDSNLLMHKLEKTAVEKPQQCIENFIMKQDKLFMNLESKIERTLNENNVLQSKICSLRDLLHSYGLLKASKSLSTLNPSIDLPSLSTDTDSFNENELFDLNLKPLVSSEMASIINILKSTFSKFKSLGISVDKLHSGIKSSQALNDNLLFRVQDQELHLKGITKELKEAQVLVSVMKQQHQKLQSAEGIFKYDLQEKRKLMTKLKQQLESTREDWNRVRQKNSKSEAEWRDLRKEFVLRQKQASEESGFIDDKDCESKNISNKHKANTIVVENNITNCSELPSTEKKSDTNEIPQKKTRLERLEEQCQNLYSSLLKNSTKGLDLDNRLNTICKGIDQSSNVISEQSASDPLTLTDVEAGSPILFEECIVKEDLNGDCPTESSSSNGIQTSEIGSLNSNCSSSPLVLDTETNSFDDDCSYDTTDIPNCLPCAITSSEEKGEQTNNIVNKTLNMENNVSPSFCEFTNGLDTLSNYEDFQQDLVSNLVAFQSSSLEAFNEDANDRHNTNSLTQVDSLLIKKKDLENSLEQLNIHNNCNYIDDSIRKYKQEKKEFLNEIFVLKNEKEMLQKEVVDLKNKFQMIEIQLDQLSKQLDLSRATKEQEVVALQFQLSTEALKYQRALKQFSENDKGLKDMKQKINDQEALICALEDALTEIRTEKEYDKEHRWQELEEIQFALMAREEDCLGLTHDLETLKEVNDRNQRDKESIESELIQLHGDSKDLKRKLVKLLKEKDILWKRADYLSHLQRVKIADRWVADHEVSNCLGCHNRFSLILRRHHCRLCGRIFCHTCSNNWLLTTASRKKSRVCHECYKQHLEIKQESRRGSDVPCLDEGSEDEAIDKLCTHLRSSSSFSPGYPDSLGNSFISLQVNAVGSHKKNSHLYSSAPDLMNYVKENYKKHANSLTQECDNENCMILKGNEISETVMPPEKSEDSYISYDAIEHTKNEIMQSASTTLLFTTTEIKAIDNGIVGEVCVNAGVICRLHISNENPPNKLYWTFFCDSERIPVSLHCGKKDCLKFVICNNELEMEDHMELSLPGAYILQLDNSSSRVAQRLKYSLKINNDSEINMS